MKSNLACWFHFSITFLTWKIDFKVEMLSDHTKNYKLYINAYVINMHAIL